MKNSIDHVIDLFSQSNPGSTFIQIGANDGVKKDPIHKYVIRDKWKGIFVEPQKVPFRELLNTYEKYNQAGRFVFENCAISEVTGKRKLYKIALSNERWAHGLSSFSEEVLHRHISSGYIDRCLEQENISIPKHKSDYFCHELVPTLTFGDLIKKHSIKEIDYLVLDTEGYDAKILSMVDIALIKPKLILFEHAHLDKDEYSNCLDRLKKFDYTIINNFEDTLAIHNDIIE